MVEHARCINLAAAAKKFVNPEICMNILLTVGFHNVNSETAPTDAKQEIKIADNDKQGDKDRAWLTMDEFKLCYGILDQNWESIMDAYNVTNPTFCGCVSCVYGIFGNLNCIFFYVLCVKK